MADHATARTEAHPEATVEGQSIPVRLLQVVMQGIVIVLVCAAPWPYGCVHPGFDLLLLAGVGLLLVCWAVRLLLEGRLRWQKCPVLLCLAGLFLLGIWQVTPLPRPVLDWVSPNTARLYNQLLPAQPEIVAGDEKDSAPIDQPGRTISLYPTATRAQLIQLLSFFVVFAVVRNNTATPAGLRWLSAALLVNGAALSVFALVQRLSSSANTLYWTYSTNGTVFGPFICRNHFPFYINLCIGMGIGLILDSGRGSRERKAPLVRRGEGSGEGVLRNPAVAWICAALALMVVAVLFSLSRGGVLALGIAALVCLILKRSQAGLSPRGGAVFFVAGLAALLGGWLGYDLVAERMATIWKGEAIDNRWPLWMMIFPLIKDFPVWGTGYGTFQSVELMVRQTAVGEKVLYEHAHNDYLEMLIEGGGVGLGLTLLAIGWVFLLGYRALGRGKAEAGLALGALFGFATLVAHSFGDFGMHVPAIALLAAVLSAHLCALGTAAGQAREQVTAFPNEREEEAYNLRLGGLAPVLGAGTLLAMAVVLVGAAWKAHCADRLEVAATRFRSSLDDLDQCVVLLAEAARIAPEDAEVEVELGQVRSRLYERNAERLNRNTRLSLFAGAVLSASTDWAATLAWSLTPAPQKDLVSQQQQQLARRYLDPALRDFCRARNACPLLRGPHLMLASHLAWLARSDPRNTYLDRAKFLAPGDPDTWHLCGIQELQAGEPNRAWASWRRCLELSDRHLQEILEASLQVLDSDALVETVLPDRPERLVTAARRLYPDAASEEQRRPFFLKALRVLEAKPDPLSPEDLHAKAVACRAIGRSTEALATYQELLTRQHDKIAWRYELAEVLREQGQLENARRELVIVLAQQPAHPQARELMAIVAHELRRKK